MAVGRIGKNIATEFLGLWGVITIVLAWEIIVRLSGVNPIVMPKPSSIFMDILNNPKLYAVSAFQTTIFAVAGLIAGVFVGTSLAILSWLSRVLSGVLTPVAIIFASVPVVAMIPVLARIFGYDMRTVLAIVAIISFFPAFVFTTAGLRSLPAGSDDLFTVLGVGTLRRLWFLALPSAIPEWSIALRLAAANAILAAIVAEFLMGTSGLGYMFGEARSSLNMVRALGASSIAAAISVAAFLTASAFETWARSSWR